MHTRWRFTGFANKCGCSAERRFSKRFIFFLFNKFICASHRFYSTCKIDSCLWKPHIERNVKGKEKWFILNVCRTFYSHLRPLGADRSFQWDSTATQDCSILSIRIDLDFASSALKSEQSAPRTLCHLLRCRHFNFIHLSDVLSPYARAAVVHQSLHRTPQPSTVYSDGIDFYTCSFVAFDLASFTRKFINRKPKKNAF